jgi:hypothetical protein
MEVYGLVKAYVRGIMGSFSFVLSFTGLYSHRVDQEGIKVMGKRFILR